MSLSVILRRSILNKGKDTQNSKGQVLMNNEENLELRTESYNVKRDDSNDKLQVSIDRTKKDPKNKEEE